MVREPNIPLFLWIATAILVHLTSGGGADRISEIVQEQMDVRRFARSVSTQVRRAQGTIEVTLEGPERLQPEPPAGENVPPPEPEAAPEEEPTEPEAKPEEPELDPEPEKKPEAEPSKKPEEQEKEPEKKPVELPLEPEVARAEPVQMPRRIAVQQLVEDPNQAANPNAEFIGDHNNRVSEQTQARITSTEQNDAKPQPGGEYAGPASEPGNAHVSEIAQMEDREGAIDRAPGNPHHGDQEESAAPERAQTGSSVAERQRTQGAPQHAHSQQVARREVPEPDPGSPAREARASTPENPDLLHSADGQYRVAESSPAQTKQQGQKGKRPRKAPAPGPRRPDSLLGLGSNSTTPGGINLNLSHKDALATVGQDKLSQQILADGERRRSKHRGSWRFGGLERWRSAIENYVPHIKPGNHTALNSAHVPFGLYLHKLHLRLHPIFADSYLAHLDTLPGNHPLNRMDMSTNLEIVLSRTDGSIVDMGVTKASGVTGFDINALEAVARAAPFGTPPSAIVSPDGNVYLHWEFWRDPRYACSTYFAYPKMLRADPKSAPVDPPLPAPLRPEEDPIPNQGRQGLLPTPRAPHSSRLARPPGLAHLW